MLGWLRWLWPRGHSEDVFTFSDGTRTRRVDPLVAVRVLETECPQYADLFALLVDDTPLAPGPVADDMRRQRSDAMVKLVAVARKMFGLTPLGDAGGTTEAFAFRVLGDLILWLDRAGDEARPFSIWRSRASPSTPPGSPAESSAASGTDAPKSPPPATAEP